MTDLEINQTIAELCGWHNIQVWEGVGGIRFLKGCFGPLRGFRTTPNYVEDLNAMAEAEDWLCAIPNAQWRYAHYLYNVTVPADRQSCRATAKQRAQAFIHTVEELKAAGIALPGVVRPENAT